MARWMSSDDAPEQAQTRPPRRRAPAPASSRASKLPQASKRASCASSRRRASSRRSKASPRPSHSPQDSSSTGTPSTRWISRTTPVSASSKRALKSGSGASTTREVKVGRPTSRVLTTRRPSGRSWMAVSVGCDASCPVCSVSSPRRGSMYMPSSDCMIERSCGLSARWPRNQPASRLATFSSPTARTEAVRGWSRRIASSPNICPGSSSVRSASAPSLPRLLTRARPSSTRYSRSGGSPWRNTNASGAKVSMR